MCRQIFFDHCMSRCHLCFLDFLFYFFPLCCDFERYECFLSSLGFKRLWNSKQLSSRGWRCSSVWSSLFPSAPSSTLAHVHTCALGRCWNENRMYVFTFSYYEMLSASVCSFHKVLFVFLGNWVVSPRQYFHAYFNTLNIDLCPNRHEEL